ncbi:MAG: stage II sporulation protein P [Ignavibacteriales bacterium]
MRKWRKRLLRNWRIGLAYAGTVTLLLLVLIAPVSRRPQRSVMVISPPAGLQTGEAAGPAGTEGTRSLDSLLGDLRRALLRQAFRSCLPWPMIADEAGDEKPLVTGLRDAVLAVFGLKVGPPGLLAGGIPVMGYGKIDVYMDPPVARGEPGPAEPAVTAITRMPPASAVTPWPGGPVVGIYHTHARESFLPELPEANVMRPDDAHTEDLRYTVVRLGQEIASTLNTAYGIGAVHSTVVHDDDGKLGAYIRSEATVSKILQDYPSVGILLDVHRDSQPRELTTLEFRGLTYAKVMIVLGTDNPGWKKNEEFANQLLAAMQAKYPGISLGVYPKPGQFNQHYCTGGLVLEVGGVENTLEECLRTSRVIAEGVAYLIRGGKIPRVD